jgi:molecular chaperone DnaJ
MTIRKDFYSILGVAKTATEEEIKKAYKKLAVQYHPDKNQGNKEAEEIFKGISEAYSTLSNKDKRSQYDNPSRGNPNMWNHQGGFPGVNFEDIFEDFFKTKESGKGNNLQINRMISLKESVYGTNLELDLNYPSQCKPCGGTGAKDGKVSQCTTCKGSGRRILDQGFLRLQQACNDCRGSGKRIDPNAIKCRQCHGQGQAEVKRRVSVKVPAGIKTGQNLRLTGLGDTALSGHSGDLIVAFTVKEDPNFQRVEDNIMTPLDVPFVIATLGGKLPITDLEGNQHEVEIPVGSQHGVCIKVPGKGVPNKGDLYGVIQLKVPTNLSEETRKKLEELRSDLM